MTSRHPKARQLVEEGIFQNLRSFAQFERRVQALANTKQVGDAFEILVEAYLHTQPHMQAANVLPVGQVPLRIRKRLNLPSDSKGIDGVWETRTGDLVPYQVKYRTDTDVLPYGEVSSFLGITERSCKDRVIFTNARALSRDVENRDGLRSVRANHFNSLTNSDFRAIEAWLMRKPAQARTQTTTTTSAASYRQDRRRLPEEVPNHCRNGMWHGQDAGGAMGCGKA